MSETRLYLCHLLQGSKESLLSATISANEEAMTILEEVIMYTFQQCVYYITKVICDSSNSVILLMRYTQRKLSAQSNLNYYVCVSRLSM